MAHWFTVRRAAQFVGLWHQSRDLPDGRRHLQRYHALLLELRAHLGALATATGAGDCRCADLQRRPNDGLARALATEPVATCWM